MHDGDAVGAFDAGQGGFHRIHQPQCAVWLIRFIKVGAHQVGEHLRVRLGEKGVAFGDELVAQRLVVFDHPIVDEHQLAGLVRVRVGVHVRGRAVGGPAGVGDAHGAQRIGL